MLDQQMMGQIGARLETTRPSPQGLVPSAGFHILKVSQLPKQHGQLSPWTTFSSMTVQEGLLWFALFFPKLSLFSCPEPRSGDTRSSCCPEVKSQFMLFLSCFIKLTQKRGKTLEDSLKWWMSSRSSKGFIHPWVFEALPCLWGQQFATSGNSWLNYFSLKIITESWLD